MDGILLIDKPAGLTTRQIDNHLKHVYSTKKIGHAGTLDPFATGLVLVGVNQGTKALSFFEYLDKTYIATLKLGERTKSGDNETEVVETTDVPELNDTLISYKMLGLLGEQKQVPPMYSAIKINGKPLYELARQDIEVERDARNVTIFGLKLISYNEKENTIQFEAHVSKGTYIRTLGEDIAKALGTVGHLIALRRIKIGKFSIGKAIKYEDINESTRLYSIPSACYFIPKVPVNEKIKSKVQNGVPMKVKTKSDILLFVDQAKPNKAISFYMRSEGGYFRCKRGLNE